jgi:hypothetical protein
MPKITAHLTPETLDACNARGSVSGTINRAIGRYVELIERERIEEQFTASELDAIRDALGGWHAEPAAMVAGGPALEVSDALEDGLADSHGVDGGTLLSKLAGLSYPQEVALVDAVERYWHAVSAAHAKDGA